MADAVGDLSRLYRILDRQSVFVSDDSAAQARVVCCRFGVAYAKCRAVCARRGIMAFEITPKVHKTQHLAENAQIFIPMKTTNYAFESSISTTANVWKRSLSGRYKKMCPRNVVVKRLVVALLRMDW